MRRTEENTERSKGMELADEKMRRLDADSSPLGAREAEELGKHVPEWELSEGAINREFTFDDFVGAMEFVNEVADVAEKARHHPDIMISYNRVRLELSTHSIGGLSRNDFIAAARLDRLVGGWRSHCGE